MKQIIVTFRDREESSKKLVTNNLQWYDPIKKEIFKFEGGELEFEYKEDEYLLSIGAKERFKRGIQSTFRLLPKIKDLEVKTKIGISDNNLFIKFFNNYLNYNLSDITMNIDKKKNAICFVPDNEIDDFSYQLNRQGFYYETQ
ncbi:MAG: hypothetical protein KAH05_05870 [Clostridiales bacterium]|nr:hypothetical protein [Clostridiales bacterium]